MEYIGIYIGADKKMKMNIIRNKYIPFGGFRAINLFGVLFVKGNSYISQQTINHESIHTAQMKELAYIGFYLWYVIEWIVRVLITKDRLSHRAYRNISFEREAYSRQSDTSYLTYRMRYAWIRHITLI